MKKIGLISLVALSLFAGPLAEAKASWKVGGLRNQTSWQCITPFDTMIFVNFQQLKYEEFSTLTGRKIGESDRLIPTKDPTGVPIYKNHPGNKPYWFWRNGNQVMIGFGEIDDNSVVYDCKYKPRKG